MRILKKPMVPAVRASGGIQQLTRLKQEAYKTLCSTATPELTATAATDCLPGQPDPAGERHAGNPPAEYEAQVTADVGFLERNKALSDLSSHEPSVLWAMLLISLLIILIETGPILSKLIMNTGPYDLALAGMELRQMAAAEEDMRQDRELVMNAEGHPQPEEGANRRALQKLTALQKKHIQEELDQWERGEDKIPPRMPLEDLTRRIRQRYHFREDDVI